MITSKERVMTAINHEEPDMVPIDSWLVPEVEDIISVALNLDNSKDSFILPKTLGNDILYTTLGFCDGWNSIYKEERRIGDNLFQDAFKIKYTEKFHKYGSYCEIVEHPFADIKNYENYKWPDPLIIYKEGLESYKNLIEKDGKEYAILGGCPCTIFEASWYLRGIENFLMDLYINRDFAEELFDRTMEVSLEVSKKLVEMGVDIIFWGDDVANERGPYFDPKLFRELLKPRYSKMLNEIKSINKDIKVAYHSDGKVDWLLGDLVDIGIDIVHPLQPDVNDIADIKKRFGKKLTFWGNVDTRRVMNRGSFSDVVEEVRKTIEILSPGGGHILNTNHYVQASERAVDNVIIYYWAADKFRYYPLNVKKLINKIKVN